MPVDMYQKVHSRIVCYNKNKNTQMHTHRRVEDYSYTRIQRLMGKSHKWDVEEEKQVTEAYRVILLV